MKKYTKIAFFAFILVMNGQAISGEATSDDYKSEAHVTFAGDYDKQVIDPEKPSEVVDPGESAQVGGKLRIDLVPELRFGEQQISKEETTYFAYAQNFHSETSARGNYLQVSDFRGENGKGWKLYLKQEKQFSSVSDPNLELIGASLFFDKSWTSSSFKSASPNIQTDIIRVNPGNSYLVADAQPGTGEGKWAISFGAGSEEVTNVGNTLKETEIKDEKYGNKPVYLNQAVGLTVPNTANVQAATYQTVLTWTLSELP